MPERSRPPPLSVYAAIPPKRRRRTRSAVRAKMPLFSEHISNMYYSGCPSYHSPYSYGSSFSPLGTSYSASYLNPGGSYSNHSSLGGYSRTPITSRWIPSGRTYSPILSTISERGTSTPVRINSPRRTQIQSRPNRTYVSANYTPRPVNINTADIDVSRDKYRNKTQIAIETSKNTPKENSNFHEDKSPLTPRVEEKPETGIDTSPGTQRGVIKRERTVVRLHTLKRKERDSPRKPVDEIQKNYDNDKSKNVDRDCENKVETAQSKRWREKLSQDLIYKDTREKKTLGEKLIEKFQIKSKDTEVTNEDIKSVKSVIHDSQNEENTNINSKSLDRRCSMEMLAEQACLFDSLIRKENLSTATLDLSKIGTSEISLDGINSSENGCSDNLKEFVPKISPLTTTKSDHSLHNRVNNFRDQKHTTKRRSIKKSSSGGNISKLDSITEFPKDFKETILPAIDESRQSCKHEKVFEQKPKTKPIIKTKITSTVEVTPPSSPLKFKVENITVEEKPRTLRKEVMFSSEVVNEDNTTGVMKNINTETSSNTKVQEDIKDPASPEPEDGNFWIKIGKRETLYLTTRKQKLERAKENQQRALFWYPDEQCDEEEINDSNNKILSEYTNNINVKSNNCNEIKLNSELDKTKSDVRKTLEQTIISEITSQTSSISGDTNTVPIIKPSEGLITSLETKSVPAVCVKRNQQNFANDFKNDETCNENINIKTELSILESQELLEELPSTSNTEDIQVTQNSNNNNDNRSESAAKLSCNEHKEKVKESSLSKQVRNSDKEKHMKKVSTMKTKDQMEETKVLTGDIVNKIIDNQNEAASTNSKNILQQQSEIDSANNLKVNVNETELSKLTLEENSEIKNNTKNEMSINDMETYNVNNLKNSKSRSLNITSNETSNNINEENKDLPSEKNGESQDKNDFSREILQVKDYLKDNFEKCTITKSEETEENIKKLNESKKENKEKDITRESVKLLVNTNPVKPVKEQKALKPLIATPRPLQKKVPHLIRSTSTSDTSSDDETSDDEDEEESDSSEDSNELFECENQDGRTSTGSNDSGFDSSASTSPAGFIYVRKDCDVNCHRKCEKLTANLCGVNQRLLVEALATRTASRRGGECPSTSAGIPPGQKLGSDILEQELEQSTAYGLFKKTGRFTPPARSIPRFRKYTIEDFQFIKVLGKGSFGKVLLAELRDTEYYYAVKCLKKDVVLEDDDVECTLIERKVLALGTNHPYLCHLFATFQTDSHLFFVMEYLNGGDLMFHIQQSGRFPEPRARFYAAEIVSGLKFLHKRGIIYRDLKLDNILLDFDGHVRIADFGMCKLQIYLDKTADTFCGTPDYMAPEIIKGLKYNQAVDWWSFGVLLYEMLIGQSPFSGCDEDELFWSICNEMPSYPRFLSQEALSILTRLLDKDARSRLGGAECMHGDVRDQDFFRSIAWDRLDRRDLEAPFKPRVRHPLDTQYFDRTFTGERPRLTAVEPHVLRSMDQEPFRGFSYTNPNATDR